jgi:uncharacterized membrane protein
VIVTFSDDAILKPTIEIRDRRSHIRYCGKRGEAKAMTITLPLQPQEEARLMAAAHARGLSADALVREALEGILAETPAKTSSGKEPTRSLRGILAKYGPAPSAEEIDQNRAEMFANFPRSDF